MFPTETKDAGPPAGCETLKEIAEKLAQPVVAIGGINADNAAELYAAGAACLAVCRAVCAAEDPKAAAQAIRAHAN